MKKIIGKITSSVMITIFSASIVLNPMQANASAENTNNETVANAILKTAELLEGAIQDSYDAAEDEVKQICVDKGYDYYLTMESFHRAGMPYKDSDYVKLIAAYSVAKKNTNTLEISDMYSLDFIVPEVKRKMITEEIPEKHTVYEIDEESGEIIEREKYIDTSCKIDQYELNSDGIYVLIGQETVNPKVKSTKYGEVTLNSLSPEDIFSIYNLKDDSILKEFQKQCNKFDSYINSKGLGESLFINLRRSLISNEDITYFTSLFDTESLTDFRKGLVSVSLSLVGKVPYDWGGKAAHPGYDSSWWTVKDDGKQKGLDCSGFVQWSFMTLGYSKDIYDNLISTREILSNLQTISKDELQPGDLGLLNNGVQAINHVGIYAGDNKWIHCSSGSGTVVVQDTNMFQIFKRMPDPDSDTIIEPTWKVDNETENKNEFKEEGYVSKSFYDSSSYFESIGYHNECSYDESDIYLLAQLICNEANGEGVNGWIAVAEVVKNRVESEEFPDSIKDVIYAPSQFSDSDKIAKREPSENQLIIARDVLSGNISILNNPDCLFFRNANGSTEDWGDYEYYETINNHQFYTL